MNWEEEEAYMDDLSQPFKEEESTNLSSAGKLLANIETRQQERKSGNCLQEDIANMKL